MVCYNPLQGFRGPLNQNGRRPIVFREAESVRGERVDVPCGRCIGCKKKYSLGWAVRCIHEAQMHSENCFVTLTFDNNKLCDLDPPYDGSVHVRHVQLFLKRLRKWRADHGQRDIIKYFFAAEYGGRFGRPHYHGLLFGHDFTDKKFEVERFGNRLYSSPGLSSMWPSGFSSVGDVTFASAGYVSRYCNKKTLENKDWKLCDDSKRYEMNFKTGEVRRVEFTVMSRGGRNRSGGVGSSWFDRYQSDVFPSDEVVINGSVQRPPRYYDNLLDKFNPYMLRLLKERREKSINKMDNTLERLKVKEEVAIHNTMKLLRPLEI